jgi:hypothetical protein
MTEAGRQQGPPGQVRFTRRQLREATGFGDTQLKVHLARLTDLELLSLHRGEHGGYCYALAWRGEGQDGAPFLPGLADPADLADPAAASHHDQGRPGPAKIGSAPGRPPAGGQSAPGRDASRPAAAQLSGPIAALPPVITPGGMVPGPVNGTAVVVAGPPSDSGGDR